MKTFHINRPFRDRDTQIAFASITVSDVESIYLRSLFIAEIDDLLVQISLINDDERG